MKTLNDTEAATLRTTFAATLVALQRGNVPLGPELQRLLKQTWDIVRNKDDPALAFNVKKPSLIHVPFGEHFQ